MDEKVQQFIENLESFMPEKVKIIIELRKIIFQTMPKVSEVLMYGGLVYKTDKLLCGLFARKNHVTVELGGGAEMDDPHSVLEGKGKERRHIKILVYYDIKRKKVKYYIEKSCHL